MSVRELIVSILDLMSGRKVTVIIAFFIALIATYVFFPLAWQEFLINKTPAFLPFGINLFDMLVLCVSLGAGLVCSGLIRFYLSLKRSFSTLSRRSIKRIYLRELNDSDRLVLLSMVYGQYLQKDHPTVMASQHKLREKKLIGYGPFERLFVVDLVESFIYEQVESGQIDLENTLPRSYS